MNGLQHSPLTDGYALGMTFLVTLMGQPAVGLRQRCRLLLRYPSDPTQWTAAASPAAGRQQSQPPVLPDASAGVWSEAVSTGLLMIVCGLTSSEDKEDRMPVPEALELIEALLALAIPVVGEQLDDRMPTPVAAPPPQGHAAEERLCVICEAVPRAVRFRCGHAMCCAACVTLLRARDGLCPQCRQPIGAGEQAHAEIGAHIAHAPTFVMATAPRPSNPQHSGGSPDDAAWRGILPRRVVKAV